MNRLAPLVVRRPRTLAMAAAMPVARMPAAAAPAVSDDLRLFASSYLAGLVFFGTYLA
ncbi:MAG TPA: hypothetical protein VEW25_01710 [Allosphingosinicella sp.]|nr:hypothetical protein [Allosphingosinicella sp.]